MNNWPRQRFVELADGVVAVLNGQGEMGVANAALVVEEDRALVIDTMTFPEMAQEMAKQIARRGPAWKWSSIHITISIILAGISVLRMLQLLPIRARCRPCTGRGCPE